MIQYVLTYYPNVGASKRETANGGTQPARGGRAGAAAGRPGRGRKRNPTSRAALRLDALMLERKTYGEKQNNKLNSTNV